MHFRTIFPGVLLVVAGLYFLLDEFTTYDLSRFFWPLILITVGILLLVQNRFNSNTPSN